MRSCFAIAEPWGALRARGRHRGAPDGVLVDEDRADAPRVPAGRDRRGGLSTETAARAGEGLAWPRPAYLANTLRRLSVSPSEILHLSLHRGDGGFIAGFDYPGDRGAISLRYRALIGVALSHHADRLMLIHNHPSGNASPSAADEQATAGLLALCRPLDLAVHDHLIVGGETVFSMRRRGWVSGAGSMA